MARVAASESRSGSTDEQLIRRVQVRDGEAWRQFVRVYTPLVRYWIHRRARVAEADLEDLLQDVFLTIARSVVGFQPDGHPASFRRWLRTITNSRLTDAFRRGRMNPATAAGGSSALDRLQQQPAPGESEEDTKEGRWLLLEHALVRVRLEFEVRTFEAAWRVLVESCSVADVARDLGLTPEAVRVYKSRILHRLREILEELRD